MYRHLLIFILLLFISNEQILGQSCTHSELSKNFIFKTSLKRIPITEFSDSCIITVSVKNKIENKTIFIDQIISNFLLGDSSFVQCNNVRSFTTGINKNLEVADNDYGDLIIEDFNFDGMEDFAVKREEGGNGGPLYNYYIQTKDTTFFLDKYLSKSMIWFPAVINPINKTLVTLVHASAYDMCESTYKFDTSTNKWKRIKKRFVK